jgi:hypothetical protein
MNTFTTAFSERKYARGGGRSLLWLQAFERVEIDRVFDAADEGCLHRSFTFDAGYDPRKWDEAGG